MSYLFLFIMSHMGHLGELKEAMFYGKDFATIEFTKGGKQYSFTIREREEENNDIQEIDRK